MCIRDRFESKQISTCLIILYPHDDFPEKPNIKGFADFYLYFNFDKYAVSSDAEKKMMQLEAVHQGMLGIAVEQGWNTEPFEIAYQALSLIHILKNIVDGHHKYQLLEETSIFINDVEWVIFDSAFTFKDKEDSIEVKFTYNNCLYKIQTYLYEVSDISFLIHSFKYYNEL